MPKLSGLALSRLGVVLGCLIFVAGIGLAINVGWSLVFTGVLVVAGCLLFIETDVSEEARK